MSADEQKAVEAPGAVKDKSEVSTGMRVAGAAGGLAMGTILGGLAVGAIFPKFGAWLLAQIVSSIWESSDTPVSLG